LPLVANAQGGEYGDDEDGKTYYSGRFDGDARSLANSDSYGNVFRVSDRPGDEKGGLTAADETAEELQTTSKRKKWVALTWLLTWWIPGFLLSLLGRMKRKDVRMAWREKVRDVFRDCLRNLHAWLTETECRVACYQYSHLAALRVGGVCHCHSW
jgi:hypothetical protein